MKFEIIPKSDIIPSYDPNAVAVKYIEDNSNGEQYEEDEITPDLISKELLINNHLQNMPNCVILCSNNSGDIGGKYGYKCRCFKT